METITKTEVVICTCSQEHGISGAVCCLECNREIVTRVQLCERRIKIARQMSDLRVQMSMIDIELFMRKEHKPSRKVLYHEDFFKGVKKAPMEYKKGNSVDYKAEAKAMLAGLD
jgi:hypothetical protein